MKLHLGLAILSSLLLQSAHAADLIGGTVQNKRTHEILALSCAQRTSEGCSTFQFVIGNFDKHGNFVQMDTLGHPVSYEATKDALQFPDNTDTMHFEIKELAGVSGDLISHKITAGSRTITGGVFGTELVMSAKDKDYKTSEKIWRTLAGIALIPVALVADVSIYSTAVVGDGLEAALDAPMVGIHNLIDKIKDASDNRKMAKAFITLSQAKSEGKKLKVSDSFFSLLSQQITNASWN